MKKSEKTVKYGEKWIIKSLCDVDMYKLTMLQFIFVYFRFIQVVFGFKNRTKTVKIANIVKLKEVRKQFDYVMTLKVKKCEIEYMGTMGFFLQPFLDFFRTLRLSGYTIRKEDGQFVMEFSGNWVEVSLWETISLSIMNELYYRALLSKMSLAQRREVYKEGRRRLVEKIRILKENSWVRFLEFGTRRRFSAAWQYYVVSKLKQEVPEQMIGTSNVYLAMKLGIKPVGTFAHELYMVMSGIFRSYAGDMKDNIRASHNFVLQKWWEMYGEALSIALTDTYGSPFFFRDMCKKMAELWRGLRQDSGDPIEFGEETIKFYEGHEIDPKSKVIVFSDGLNIDKILKIGKHFMGRIQVVFGWGTDLTNDLGLKALSMVVKVITANGWGTVKLSDNLAKAMGSLEDIELFKCIFGHTSTLYEECVY